MAVTCNPVAKPCGDANCPATLQCLWKGNGDAITPTGILPEVIYATVFFVGLVSLGMIIFAGFKYITSQADKKTLDSANKTLFYAAMGLVFVLFSFFILNLIGMATGVTCIEPQNVLQNGFNACK